MKGLVVKKLEELELKDNRRCARLLEEDVADTVAMFDAINDVPVPELSARTPTQEPDTFWRRPGGGHLLLRPEPRVAAGGGLHSQMMPSSTETHTAGEKIRILAQRLWPNTFRLDCTLLGQPIGPVTRQNSWEAYMGQPMQQPVRDTCALVACTVAVEAAHRFAYEKVHGQGTFPRRAVVPCDLIEACSRDSIWVPGKGAYVGAVLTKIQQMGSVPVTDGHPTSEPCVLPLRSWQKHRWDATGNLGTQLSQQRVAALLDSHGSCLGVLWVCPWYFQFDAGVDDALVYRGCGRSEDDRRESWRLYSGNGVVGSHAVVYFAYRFSGDQMHVLVRDNHNAAANGPQRWIDVEELDALYTLTVERLNPPMASPTLSHRSY